MSLLLQNVIREKGIFLLVKLQPIET